jgi:hypothetical protein
MPQRTPHPIDEQNAEKLKKCDWNPQFVDLADEFKSASSH